MQITTSGFENAKPQGIIMSMCTWDDSWRGGVWGGGGAVGGGGGNGQ